MNLDLNSLNLRIDGRKRAPLVFDYVRDIEPDDVEALEEVRQSVAPPIKKLRARHHSLARLLASGVAEGDAAIMVGYSPSRVSILKGDPAFEDLLNFYSGRQDARHFDMQEKMADVLEDIVEEVHDRLENEPETFTNSQLNEFSKTFMDRSGFGPSSKQEVNVKVGLSDRLESARKRLKAQRKDSIIDAEAIEVKAAE